MVVVGILVGTLLLDRRVQIAAVFAYQCFLKPFLKPFLPRTTAVIRTTTTTAVTRSTTTTTAANTHQERLESFYEGQKEIYDTTRKRLLRGRSTMLRLCAEELGRRRPGGTSGSSSSSSSRDPTSRRSTMNEKGTPPLCAQPRR